MYCREWEQKWILLVHYLAKRPSSKSITRLFLPRCHTGNQIPPVVRGLATGEEEVNYYEARAKISNTLD